MSENVSGAQVGKSAMAIAGLVIGIVALCTSFLPIINNFSALLAVLGLVFAVIGLVSTLRGKKSGKGLAIAGVIICVVSFAVVLYTQSVYSKAVDDAFSGSTVAPESSEQQASVPASENDANQSETVAAGNAITLKNGLVLSVDSVVTGLVNYDGSPITQVTVTYQNNSDEQASFNPYDWKGEDAQGAQRSTTYYSDGENNLNSGTIAAGGTVSGNLYFDGEISKVLYENVLFGRGSEITWTIA